MVFRRGRLILFSAYLRKKSATRETIKIHCQYVNGCLDKGVTYRELTDEVRNGKPFGSWCLYLAKESNLLINGPLTSLPAVSTRVTEAKSRDV